MPQISAKWRFTFAVRCLMNKLNRPNIRFNTKKVSNRSIVSELQCDFCLWTNCRTRQTSSSAIAERPRCRVGYSYGQKWKTGTEVLTDPTILRTLYVYQKPLGHNWPEKQSNSVKKRKIRAITPFKVIQGHRDRYQSIARMRLPISD